jgi:hypothetical protein
MRLESTAPTHVPMDGRSPKSSVDLARVGAHMGKLDGVVLWRKHTEGCPYMHGILPCHARVLIRSMNLVSHWDSLLMASWVIIR